MISKKRKLLPLYGSAGLRRQIKEDAVDTLDLAGDTGGDVLEEVEGDIFHGGGHSVHGIDRADDDAPLLGTLIVPDAHRFQIGDSGKVLPNLALQAVFGKLLPEDGVGLPDGLQAVPGDGSQAAHTQAGAGEGLAVDHAGPGPCRRPGPHP